MRFLSPIDLCHQFIVKDDEQATELGEGVVKAIVLHGASPDQDFRQQWIETVNRTAEHLRLGHHPEEQ
jgi:hypothetical protein